MRITRTGAYRNAGTSILADEDIAKRKNDRRRAPEWNTETHEIVFDTQGRDRGSSYRYRVRLSAAELLSFIEIAAVTLTPDVASRAVAIGAAATLRELLVPNEVAKHSKQ